MLTGYMRECNVASPGLFILCGCSGFIQKHCRIVHLCRTLIIDCLMASLKVIIVDISSDGFSCFLEISILREIRFLILEASEPALNHDIICQAAFTIHALANTVITNESSWRTRLVLNSALKFLLDLDIISTFFLLVIIVYQIH